QEAVEHQISSPGLRVEAAQLAERLRMIVDADVEPWVFLARIDLERGGLFAALVAAGGLARVECADESLRERQMGARFVGSRGVLDHHGSCQHVARDREAGADQMSAPLDAVASCMRGGVGCGVEYMELPHLSALVAREQRLDDGRSRHALRQQA